MITDAQLIAYQSGAMTGSERAEFELALAADEDALRRLMDQERIDVALRFIVSGAANRARVRQSILEVATGSAARRTKQEVLNEVKQPADHGAVAGLFRRWFAVRGFATAGLAIAACLALAALCWPKHEARKTVAVAPPVMTVSNTLDAVAPPRDPAKWPFTPNSPWNTSIGAAAVFEDINPAGLNLSSGVYIANVNLTHPVFIANETDPVGQIFVGDSTTPFATVQIPEAARARANKPSSLHLISPDHTFDIELTDAERMNGHDLHAARATRGDLRSSGIPPEFASANSSGLSQLAGSIRQGELSAGIYHPLGAVVPLEVISPLPSGASHVWPAGWSPNDPRWRQRLSHGGNVQLGALLAIPPSVDITKLGVGTSGPEFEIARALQDYGVYVKDAFDGEYFAEWQAAGRPGLVLCAELQWVDVLKPRLQPKLASIIRELKLVTNNRPQSVGGGGKPRRPSAPELAAPAKGQL